MPFYSFEMILVGIILLSGMTAGGIKMWLNRKQESDNLNLENSGNPENPD